MLLGVNSSITDLQHTLKLMDIRDGDEVTVLIRPLCHVTFWSDVDFKGEKDTSSEYLWSRSIDGVLSATCDCATDSSIGGICPYAIDTRDFKWNEDGDGSDGPLRYLSMAVFLPEEVTTLNSLNGPRVAGAVHHQLHLLGGEDTEKHLMYAPVKPHQALRISQRSILCGSYTLRTTELKFDYVFVRHRARDEGTRKNAASKCEDLGGRLAILDRWEEVDFAARVVVKNFSNSTTSWWTAAATGNRLYGKCWLRWEGGRMVDSMGFVGCREDVPCVPVKLSWPYNPLKSFYLAKSENQLPFVCGKFPDL